MDEKEPELKPCPFCGGQADVALMEHPYESGRWFAACNDCSAFAENADTRDGAVANWNRRKSKGS